MPRVSFAEGDTTTLRAFDQFVVKLHSRCNLACDYCYVYEMRDTGWRDRPRTMPAPIRDRLVSRIGEHIRAHGLTQVRVILHGGEPLLAGQDVIAGFVDSVRGAARAAGAEAQCVLQTNGLLLDDSVLELLLELDVQVGVSLDGDREAHDRHRHARGAHGRSGSHEQVAAALARLGNPRYRRLFGGLLCTVDTANDPVRTYDALVAHRPPAVDFLLPHGTWDRPAPGAGEAGTPYGKWLCSVFDRWWLTERPVRVRLFESVIALSRYGGPGALLSTLPTAVAVVESDGTIAWHESLKAVANGAANSGGTVFGHSFDDILALPGAPVHGMGALCRTCRMCPLVGTCGGGTRAHRFGRGRGFANPSVFCGDLALLIRHIRDRPTE